MKVILTAFVKNLGTIGDIVKVKDGYGRNYLIPTGLAVLASNKNQAELEHHRNLLEKKRLKITAQKQELANKISQVKLNFVKKVGEKNRIFGTVTTDEIARKLADHGFTISRKSIKILGEIKTIGTYRVVVQLPHQIEANLDITVGAEATNDGGLP
ncbi:MAG: 50S ribosomal protein L9 [Proteobacteria bacterium]|nr:50S ribosomal protein L9 [Pseudomonadota bacterium]